MNLVLKVGILTQTTIYGLLEYKLLVGFISLIPRSWTSRFIGFRVQGSGFAVSGFRVGSGVFKGRICNEA